MDVKTATLPEAGVLVRRGKNVPLFPSRGYGIWKRKKKEHKWSHSVTLSNVGQIAKGGGEK